MLFTVILSKRQIPIALYEHTECTWKNIIEMPIRYGAAGVGRRPTKIQIYVPYFST